MPTIAVPCRPVPLHMARESQKAQYTTNTVKRRTHSLFRQGRMLYDHIPNWPEERLRPLLERFGEMLMEQRILRDAFGVI